MPRIFIAGILQETNVFSPIPTTLASFTDFWDGKGSEPSDLDLLGYGAAKRRAEQYEWEVVSSVFASATPGAPMPLEDWQQLRGRVLADLVEALPIDAVFLFLHGAQSAHRLDDCEGDLITAVRNAVGSHIKIAVELDLHANISEAMVSGSTIIMACKEYPHTDFCETAERLVDLLRDTLLGKVFPTMSVVRVPLVAIAPTTQGKVAEFVARLRSKEIAGTVLAASATYGFFGSDSRLTGAAIIIVTDGDVVQAEREALMLAGEFAETVRALPRAGQSITEILESVESEEGRFIVADRADNPGGGAAGDSTHILSALVGRSVRDAVLGMIWDPETVDAAWRAGVGACIGVRIGGKVGPLSGAPLIATATVTSLADDIRQRRFGVGEPTMSIGRSAALHIEGIDVIVATTRAQVFSREVFEKHGIVLADKRVIVVKSTQHFYRDFVSLGRVLYCDAPGTVTETLDALPYQFLRRPLYPLDQETIVPTRLDVGG